MLAESPQTTLGIVKDIVSIFGTLITATGAVAAILIGLKGLSTWRVQLKDTADRDLARRILVALYKVKASTEFMRRNFREYTVAKDKQMEPEATEDAVASQYQAEWEELSKERIELQVAAVEAQALWDKNFLRHIAPLNVCLNELKDHISEYLQSRSSRGYDPLYSAKEIREIIFQRASDKDEFAKRFNAAVDDIDVIVRKKFE